MSDIRDYWNAAILSLVTRGGYTIDLDGNYKMLCVSVQETAESAYVTKKFKVTYRTLTKLFKEVAEIKREMRLAEVTTEETQSIEAEQQKKTPRTQRKSRTRKAEEKA